jgi:hypothetical protein
MLGFLSSHMLFPPYSVFKIREIAVFKILVHEKDTPPDFNLTPSFKG